MLLKNDFMRMFLFLWPQNSFRFCFSHFDMGFCPEKMGVSTSYSHMASSFHDKASTCR